MGVISMRMISFIIMIDAYQTLFATPESDLSEPESIIDEMVESIKPKKRKRKKSMVYKGVYQIIENETRLVWDNIRSISDWSRNHYRELGYKGHDFLYANIISNIKREPKNTKYKRRFTINEIGK